MSKTYYAVSGLGIFIDLESTRAGEPVCKPSCSHDERLGENFCPVCGVKVGMHTVVTFDDDDFAMKLESLKTPKGYTISKVGYATDTFFFGFGTSIDHYDMESNSESAHRDIPALEEIKETIKKTLTEIDAIHLYNEDTFGLHAYMCAS